MTLCHRFHRDGFVVVSKVLDEKRLATIRRGCADTIREMVARDPQSAGNRGSHRYTFGTAPAHFGHQLEWATLIDPPRALAVLAAIFGSEDFHQTASASGGDFVLPGCVEYQHLHSCAGLPPMFSYTLSRGHGDICALLPDTTCFHSWLS